jgi:hypothetical protein
MPFENEFQRGPAVITVKSRSKQTVTFCSGTDAFRRWMASCTLTTPKSFVRFLAPDAVWRPQSA